MHIPGQKYPENSIIRIDLNYKSARPRKPIQRYFGRHILPHPLTYRNLYAHPRIHRYSKVSYYYLLLFLLLCYYYTWTYIEYEEGYAAPFAGFTKGKVEGYLEEGLCK